MATYFDAKVFRIMVRFLIKAAQEKRFVIYSDFEQIFSLSHNMTSYYAGKIGEFCKDNNLPLLNSLLVNATSGVPAKNSGVYPTAENRSWGQVVEHCFTSCHVPGKDRKKAWGLMEGINDAIEAWVVNNG